MSGWREVRIGLGCYAAYLAVRQLVWNDKGRSRAAHNADRVVAAERRLGVDLEPAIQREALRHPGIVDLANAAYAAGNVSLSVGWLIRLFRRGDPRFRRERRAAVFAFAVSLPVFAGFPTEPPRGRADYIDTLGERGVDLGHPLIVRFYNPIAAMPSHHVAFAVVTGLGLAAASQHPLRRAGWRLYPIGVSTVVVATGNHYVLDVAAGAVVGGLARRVTR